MRLVSSSACGCGRGGASPYWRVAKRGLAECSGRRGRAAVLAHGCRQLRLWEIGARLREACVWRGAGCLTLWGERLTHLPGVRAGGSRQPRLRLSACCLRLCRAACLCGGRWPTCFVSSEPRKRWSHRQNQSVSPICKFCHICLLFSFGNLLCRWCLRL